MTNRISQKIDAYAQANLKALKQEEAKTGRKMTKFDIAQYMLQHGKLNKNEYANWMNTREGFDAQAMTQAQKTALRQGNVWGFAGYGGGQESYLDSMTTFEQKTPIEKQNAISGHQVKLNETVAERKKKAAEMNNYIKNQQILKHIKTQAEQKPVQKADVKKQTEYNEELKKYKKILGNSVTMRRIEEVFQKLNNNSLSQKTKKALHYRICEIAEKYVEFYNDHEVSIDVLGHEYITKDNNCRDNDMPEDHCSEFDEALDNLEKFIDRELTNK